MRRLVVFSILLILAGLALLLPSSALYSLLTKGSTSTATSTVARFGVAASSSAPDNTTTIESLVGFGLIGVGAILELLSLFTDVGVAAPTRPSQELELGSPAPAAQAPASAAAPAATKPGEKRP